MNFLIVGAGKTGRRLAKELTQLGHDITVISDRKEDVEHLDTVFNGYAIVGSPIDHDVLEKAGGNSFDAVAVVTDDDNVNAMSSQILKEEFGIKNVYTRILDPTREKVFRKFGLHTVCATIFETSHMMDLMLSEIEEIRFFDFGGTSINFEEVETERRDWGKSPMGLAHRVHDMPFAVRRADGSVLLANTPDLLLERGDNIIFAKII